MNESLSIQLMEEAERANLFRPYEELSDLEKGYLKGLRFAAARNNPELNETEAGEKAKQMLNELIHTKAKPNTYRTFCRGIFRLTEESEQKYKIVSGPPTEQDITICKPIGMSILEYPYEEGTLQKASYVLVSRIKDAEMKLIKILCETEKMPIQHGAHFMIYALVEMGYKFKYNTISQLDELVILIEKRNPQQCGPYEPIGEYNIFKNELTMYNQTQNSEAGE